MTTVKTILVPVDFTEGSIAALRQARDLSSVFQCQVHLLHVAPTGDGPRWAVGLFGPQLHPLEQQDRLRALDRLATLIVENRLDPMRTTGLVRTGRPEEVIADYATQIDADLIVMGVHGAQPSETAFVGHVVERVLAGATCPVLAVPGPLESMVCRAAVPVLAGRIAC